MGSSFVATDANKKEKGPCPLPMVLLYSLVPKERHVRKESNDSTLGLYVVLKLSHDSTLIKELTPKESHDCSFSLK